MLSSHYSDEKILALAKLQLLDKEYESAERSFSRLKGSLWRSEEGRVGAVLCSILAGKDSETFRLDPSGSVSEEFPYRLLLFQSLADRRFKACSRLAELLEEERGWATLFKAAADLELGSPPFLEGLPDEPKDSWLLQRLLQTQGWLEKSPQRVVYDRRGAPIGLALAEGSLQLAKGIDELLVPTVAEHHLRLATKGGGLRLSLDLELSKMALSALDGFRGSIVILSAETGDVLVAVSDRRTVEKEGLAAFSQAREPASISKLITTTAAIRSGLNVDAEVSQMSCQGAERYRGGILYCSYRAGPLEGLDHALAISCNIAFANLGILVGRQGMLDELALYGFDRPSSAGFHFGKVLERTGNELQLADLSIGLEATSVTPLHAALIASVYGNQGFMPEPRILVATDGWLGISPVSLPIEAGREVIDAAWLPLLLSAMEAVTERGTAHGISEPGFEVAMKTGTGRNKNLGFHTNYIGIGPMPDPSISFCIRITNQITSGRVRRATLKVARRLFNELSQRTYLLP